MNSLEKIFNIIYGNRTEIIGEEGITWSTLIGMSRAYHKFKHILKKIRLRNRRRTFFLNRDLCLHSQKNTRSPRSARDRSRSSDRRSSSPARDRSRSPDRSSGNGKNANKEYLYGKLRTGGTKKRNIKRRNKKSNKKTKSNTKKRHRKKS